MSQSLFENLGPIRDRVTSAGHLLIGLDYDGTLTPIVANPAQATLEPATRQAVAALAARPDMSVAVVSGRSLADVRALVGLDNVIYAGNHGLEIAGPDFAFTEPTAARKQKTLGWLATSLARDLKPVAGALVENKALTVSIHYRNVAPVERDIVFRHVQAAAAVLAGWFAINLGDHVYELRPQIDWHKGTAMGWIADRLARANTLTFFVGDDRTDEDAFCALPDGITVKVGEPSGTSARYHLDNSAAVREFLHWLANLDNQGEDP